ncbi:hypothetical protein M9Y10_041839 [Tritrichomonas musculus]|uniref:Uncharacterized protein n=1 Tax=Tritrichomonas musculus TaxID=1915356 RepID=A0ABR2K5I0_9EUKA
MSMDDMKLSAKMNHINVNIYDYDKETMIYDLQEQWYFDDSYETKSALLYTDEMFFHIMYITNVEKLTNIFICPKCRLYVVRDNNIFSI